MVLSQDQWFDHTRYINIYILFYSLKRDEADVLVPVYNIDNIRYTESASTSAPITISYYVNQLPKKTAQKITG